MPSCTRIIEAVASRTPARALFIMRPVDPTPTVRVHVIIVDTPFMLAEQWRRGNASPADTPRAGPARLDACGRRGDAPHHLDGVATDRGAGQGGRRDAD